MLDFIADLSEKRWPWLMLMLAAFGLELSALYFQYVMDLKPCVMCVYQRFAILCIGLSAAVVLLNPKLVLLRLAGFVGWGVASVWGFLIAKEHVAMQNDTGLFPIFTCPFEPNFPDWLLLHKWIPFMFEATGSCDSIDWQFLGQSMPTWMMYIYAVFAIKLFLIVAIRVIKRNQI